jgi:hypothetical protein
MLNKKGEEHMRIEPEKRTIKYDKDPDVLKISKATTIESGALTITSGALAMTSGGLTLTSGNLTLTSGNAAITGDITGTGDITRTGDIALTGDLTGTGDQTRTGNIALTGDLTGTGDLTRTGNIALTGDLTGTGDITRVGDLTLTGSGGVSIAAASADTGAEMKIIHKQVLHSCVGGGITETLTAAIPANAYVLGVQGKIKVTVTGTTIASFLLGVTGDTNRFGNFAALTKNTATTPADSQAEAVGVGRYYNAATDILLTGDAGTFDAVGIVAVNIFYVDLSPPFLRGSESS